MVSSFIGNQDSSVTLVAGIELGGMLIGAITVAVLIVASVCYGVRVVLRNLRKRWKLRNHVAPKSRDP